MARIGDHPYNVYHSVARHKPGIVVDGLDELNRPALFRYGKFLNAVAAVAGHCAVVCADTTDSFTFTNDVSGGATAALAGPMGAGILLFAVPENMYCWILVKGFHSTALGDGSVAAGEMVTAKAADGTFDTASGTLPIVGRCLVSDTGSPTVFPGEFNFLN